MTDHTDLIARLRGPVPHTKGFNEIFVDTDRNKAERIEAADALEALRAENKRLRAHLQELQEILPPVLETARENSFATQSEYSCSDADEEGYRKEREDIALALNSLAGKE